MMPMVPHRFVESPLALELKSKSSSAAILLTLSRVSAEMRGLSLRLRETVETLTPASFAISRMVIEISALLMQPIA